MRLIEAVCLLLVGATGAGCATVQYISRNYADVPVATVETPYDNFRVYDRPGDGRMMITSSFGSAIGQGVVAGLTYNSAIGATPKYVFQEGVEKYLAGTGRRCSVTDGYLLAQPQWEFRYTCEVVAPVGGKPLQHSALDLPATVAAL